MLTRIFIDNFRCLEGFEIKLSGLNLLMGPNGSGKSAVFHVLRRLQKFIAGDCKISEAFPPQDLTRSRNQLTQRFGLDVEVGKLKFRYLLFVQHSDDRRSCWVNEESLREGDKFLFFRKNGTVTPHDDSHTPGPSYSYDPTLPAMAGAQHAPKSKKMKEFRRQIANFVIAGISPTQMEHDSRAESDRLSPLMENFISWYRREALENLELLQPLMSDLKHALPGFSSFKFEDVGVDAKALKLLFEYSKKRKSITFEFRELSDGQRVLFVLYALLYSRRGKELTLFLDEPDNYVALREIQPWLTTLGDACGESLEQAVLISHHPEVINYLGATKGRWFEREGDTVKVSEAPPKAVDGLELSETVARGWL